MARKEDYVQLHTGSCTGCPIVGETLTETRNRNPEASVQMILNRVSETRCPPGAEIQIPTNGTRNQVNW